MHNMKKAIILDLDNTIYPVSSIANELFTRFFTMLENDSEGVDFQITEQARDAITRMPFHAVADKYNFSPELKNKGIELLKNLTYDLPIQPFGDYHFIKAIPIKKLLVTTGFTNLQRSKIKMLGIENDFEEIHVVDPEVSALTKKTVFADIMKRHHYNTEDLLVIGDDPESEIAAALSLDVDTFLFDPGNKYPDAVSTFKSETLKNVILYL
jgi:putative hydrolase of the HAD superfamily